MNISIKTLIAILIWSFITLCLPASPSDEITSETATLILDEFKNCPTELHRSEFIEPYLSSIKLHNNDEFVLNLLRTPPKIEGDIRWFWLDQIVFLYENDVCHFIHIIANDAWNWDQNLTNEVFTTIYNNHWDVKDCLDDLQIFYSYSTTRNCMPLTTLLNQYDDLTALDPHIIMALILDTNADDMVKSFFIRSTGQLTPKFSEYLWDYLPFLITNMQYSAEMVDLISFGMQYNRSEMKNMLIALMQGEDQDLSLSIVRDVIVSGPLNDPEIFEGIINALAKNRLPNRIIVWEFLFQSILNFNGSELFCSQVDESMLQLIRIELGEYEEMHPNIKTQDVDYTREYLRQLILRCSKKDNDG